MWKGLCTIADSPSPIVVVLSGSMEPAFQRGDLLLLWNRDWPSETGVGEVVVYNVKDKDIPIVHRVVRKFGTGYVLFFFAFLIPPPLFFLFVPSFSPSFLWRELYRIQ